MILDFLDDHVVDEGVEHEELGLRGFCFNLFGEERKVCVGVDLNDLPYLLTLINL